jgi:two-component system chemotaxis response regulator CheY
MRQCLVVDDSPFLRKILGVMLARLGFAMVEADSGEEALGLCRESWPDLVLIDWMLPDDGGIALAQQLRKLPGGEKVKIIMCTSERSVAQIETAVAAGADEYITMPFGIDTLQTKLFYLGFELPPEENTPYSLRLRRHFSRVGFAGMTVAEEEVAQVKAGENVFGAGDAPDFAYILMAGRIALATTPAQTLEPFALFGEQALIENLPRPHAAKALTDCSLMKISRHRFQTELAAASPFLRNWIECLSDPLNAAGDET